MFSDPDARRFYPEMTDRAAARGWIDRWVAHREKHGFSLWALERLDDGSFVGDCGLTGQDVEGESILEVGYHVTLGQRRQGFAAEAAAACLRYAFEVLGAARVVSLVHVENEPSRRVAEKVHARFWKDVDRRGARHRVYATDLQEFRSPAFST